MPNRILRDGILDSRAVNSLAPEEEIFYRRLMSIVDDYGRFEADPEVLRTRLYGRQVDKVTVEMTVTWLTRVSGVLTDDGHGLVTVYRVGNKNFLQINNFKQRTRSESRYPPPSDGHVTVTCQSHARLDGGVVGGVVGDGVVCETETNERSFVAAPPLPHPAEFPETDAAVRGRFPTADRAIVLQIVQACLQEYLSVEKPLIRQPGDRQLAEAIAEAWFPKQTSAGAFLTTAPKVIRTWAELGRRGMSQREEPTESAEAAGWAREADAEQAAWWLAREDCMPEVRVILRERFPELAEAQRQ